MGQLLPGGLALYDGWVVAVAQDLPNRLGKVAVRDRTLVTTEDAERRVVTPAGLQLAPRPHPQGGAAATQCADQSYEHSAERPMPERAESATQ